MKHNALHGLSDRKASETVSIQECKWMVVTSFQHDHLRCSHFWNCPIVCSTILWATP